MIMKFLEIAETGPAIPLLALHHNISATCFIRTKKQYFKK